MIFGFKNKIVVNGKVHNVITGRLAQKVGNFTYLGLIVQGTERIVEDIARIRCGVMKW